MSMISVYNISKRYLIRHESTPYITLRDHLAHPFQAIKNKIIYNPEEFWALKDISFDIERGEVVGIIGQNGSGKSTLLKVLSQITPPTNGRAILRGRVASLLEVGTGFHPELSGRENIFLSGVILGMTRKEIIKKFDEIVAFAEVEKFLDTPVKYYSSGMGVRLGFSVAASLDSDILIIDEVLAVGDAEFQKKCLAKINDVAKNQDRTILFVSHNLEAVQSICTRAILLKKGQIDYMDQAEPCIKKYINDQSQVKAHNIIDPNERHFGLGKFAKFTNVAISNHDNQNLENFTIGQSVIVNLNFSLSEDIEDLEIGYNISTITGVIVSYFIADWEGLKKNFAKGEHKVSCTINNLACFPGIYEISVWLKRQGFGVDQEIDSVIRFSVENGKFSSNNADFGRYGTPGVYQQNIWKVEN